MSDTQNKRILDNKLPLSNKKWEDTSLAVSGNWIKDFDTFWKL